MNWKFIGTYKDGGRRYGHKIRRKFSEELKNGKMLVCNDTYNAARRFPEIVSKEEWERM